MLLTSITSILISCLIVRTYEITSSFTIPISVWCQQPIFFVCVTVFLTTKFHISVICISKNTRMMRHSSILLIILIAYLAYCFGVMIPYENNTAIYYSAKENISIACTGTDKDEVTWMHANILKGKFNVVAETPYRKVLQIRNASVFHAGRYYCVSTNNINKFMMIFILPDASCFPDNGAHRSYTLSVSNSGEQKIRVSERDYSYSNDE
ncbi:uncharacterized protein LOC135848453 [Planococcus citri]|uniref:uncharacterized protein LOC135848453 n=1 Tax=Planococcus citri TaxID=170843 RepID=UPI0031F768C0